MLVRRSFFKKVLTSMLIFAVFCSVCPSVYAEKDREDLIGEDELQIMLKRYMDENGLDPMLISVGYVYTATGESWFHNPDKWYYSASLYKVPLMMLFAEQESKGELTQESEIYGMPFSYIEEQVLTYSDNDLAYSMMLYTAQPEECRKMFQRYSAIPEEEYPWEFYSYSYFSARFMTDVMYTLFSEPERFPHIAELLTAAQPGHYFHLELGDDISIAQKYGTYHDEDESDWNHTAGIFYTRNPFILTVMTHYGGISETIIGDLAVLFYNFSLQLDEKYSEMITEEQKEDPGVPTPELEGSAVPAETLSDSFTDAEITESDPVSESRQERTDKDSVDGFKNIFRLIIPCASIAVMLPVFCATRLRRKKMKQEKGGRQQP